MSEPLDIAIKLHKLLRDLPREEQKATLAILNSLLAADEVRELQQAKTQKQKSREEKYPSLAEAEKLQ